LFHVTAHWGARTAKRLNSQLKAINVTKEAANAEVVKAKQEKVKGGYLPAPLSKVLSEEARSNLSASMGVSSTDSSKAKSKKADLKAKTPVRDKAQSKLKPLASSTVKAPIKRAAKARVNTQKNNKKGSVKIN